jgi:hypothetical protein
VIDLVLLFLLFSQELIAKVGLMPTTSDAISNAWISEMSRLV